MSVLKKIRRVIDFIPIIWKGSDFDYGDAVDLFQYQLKRLEPSIRNGNHNNATHYADRILLTIELLDRFKNDYYLEVYIENFQYDDKILEEAIRQQEKCDRITWKFINHNIKNWWT